MVALCVVTAWVYWPGLDGGFLFDDFANLPALGRYGPIRNFDSLLRYLASGIADPTGRPLSMLSFLLDARDWPAEPRPFKRSNVILHLANGLLLYAVLAALGRRLVASREARWAAALAASAWLAHPLWVSTVLYVVQRHAMLAAFFVLAGIRTWIASREAFERGAVQRGWFLALLAVPLFGLLAGFSKANGFLLPMLLLILQATVLRLPARRVGKVFPRHLRHARSASLLLAGAPALALVALIAMQALSDEIGMAERDWTLAQRLMTQPRVLFDYLFQLLIPNLGTRGIFAEDFQVSLGWTLPWTTGVAATMLAVMAWGAWVIRRRWPAIAAALLFFLGGHAMESSVIPLELYFEHRNYLPATLLFWPFALLLTSPGTYRLWRLVLCAGFLVICLMLTLAQARLWGNPVTSAEVWARASPSSARAQTHAASIDLDAGKVDRAIARLTPLQAREPGEIQYALTLLEAYCRKGEAPASVLAAVRYAFGSNGLSNDVAHQWLARALLNRGTPCPGLPDAELERFAAAALAQAGVTTDVEVSSRAARIGALLALRHGRCLLALSQFNARLDLQRRPEFAHEQVGLLASTCGPASGLAHLDHYLAGAARGDAPMGTPMLRLRDHIITKQYYWQDEWIRLRAVLREEQRDTVERDP